MKTLKKVPIVPIYVETIPEQMEIGSLYISIRYCLASHICLCGCGCEVVTPLDEIVIKSGKIVTEMPKGGWILTDNAGMVTISPSIGNYSFHCRSHYIITKNVANFV